MATKLWKAQIHYNKPGSCKNPPTPWTVHFRGTCYVVPAIDCRAPTKTEFKPHKKDNPKGFLTAMVAELTFAKDGTAILHEKSTQVADDTPVRRLPSGQVLTAKQWRMLGGTV